MSSQTIITLTGDEKSAYEAFKRIIDQEAKAVAKTKELGDAAKKAKADLAGMTLKPIDSKTLRNAKVETDALSAAMNKAKQSGQGDWFKIDSLPIMQSLSLVGALGAAIAVTTKAWDLYNKASKEALDSQKATQPGDQRLVQVSKDEKDALSLMKRADDAALSSGVDRNKSRNILFTARSEGFEPAYEAIMASSRVVDPEAQSVVAGKLPTIFNQSIKPLEAVSMTLKAAQASNLSFEQIASVAPSAAEGAALLGAGPEETLGVLSVMSAKFKSPETAADRIKAFSAGLAIDPEFKGLGLVKSYEKLAGMTEEDRSKILGGSQEMNVGYKIMGDSIPDIRKRIGELEDERKDFQAGGGMLKRQKEIATNVPSIRRQKELDRANVRKEIETESNLAEEATKREVANQANQSILERKGAGLTNRVFTYGADKALSFFAPGSVSTDDRSVMSNAFGDMAENSLWGSPLGSSGLVGLNRLSKAPGRSVTDKTVDASVQMKLEDVTGQQSANQSFANETRAAAQGQQNGVAPPKATGDLPNISTKTASIGEGVSMAFAPMQKDSIRSNGVNRLSKPDVAPQGDTSNLYSGVKTGFSDEPNRSFATEYPAAAPGQQPPQAKNNTPPKADPELLQEIKQANELAKQQAELMREQNDLLRQRPNQEPASAAITPSDVQKQFNQRR